jgi:hypothetical protein
MGKTYQSIVINAPVEKVWETVRNFHDMSWAPNVITKLEVKGDKQGDQIGAQRLLNDAFLETMLELSDLEHTIQYSIDDGPTPISPDDVEDYIGSISMIPVTETDSTFFEWSSSWDSKTDAAEDFCHNIYVAMLADLKKTLEG